MHLGALNPKEPRFEMTDRLIESWLDDRQKLIVLLHRLNQLRPFAFFAATFPVLKEFCAVLVDYVSEGQFKVFEKIFEANNLETNPSPSFDKRLLGPLFGTTIKAVDFHDKYLATENHSELAEDLSELAEHLAQRFESEDIIIELYIAATHVLK